MTPMPRPETPYMETEALLAVMNEDHQRLKSLLNDMHPGEVQELYEQVGKLGSALWERIQDGTAGDYRPRHRRTTVPESAGLTEVASPGVRHRDTGSWEPGDRDW